MSACLLRKDVDIGRLFYNGKWLTVYVFKGHDDTPPFSLTNDFRELPFLDFFLILNGRAFHVERAGWEYGVTLRDKWPPLSEGEEFRLITDEAASR